MRACLFFSLILFTSIAQGAETRAAEVCAKDSALCRDLAFEIAKLDLTESVAKSLSQGQQTNFLCPKDDPQCCPPELMPTCRALRDNLIRTTRAQLGSSSGVQAKVCPLGPEACGVLGDLYCGPEGIYLPWGECSGTLVDPGRPPQCPNGSYYDPGFGRCVQLCPAGTHLNSNGRACVPDRCVHPRFGFEIPCNIINNDLVMSFSKTSNPGPSNLTKHLADKRLQRKAAQALQKDLRAALKALDKLMDDL